MKFSATKDMDVNLKYNQESQHEIIQRFEKTVR